MSVKWGIVSTAHINRLFLAGARQSEDVEILAVASRDRQRADEYARENAIERAYGSYDALLADPDVEVVYISLPNSMHVDWTVRALEAGKHVLCEKPLSRRSKEVERAFDVAERQDRLLMEAFMYRHNPQTRLLTELVAQASGRPGTYHPRRVRVRRPRPRQRAPQRRARRRRADGCRLLLR